MAVGVGITAVFSRAQSSVVKVTGRVEVPAVRGAVGLARGQNVFVRMGRGMGLGLEIQIEGRLLMRHLTVRREGQCSLETWKFELLRAQQSIKPRQTVQLDALII